MQYCGPKGIPLDEFLSWSKASQDAALAWQAHENRRCGGCGTHPDDWNEKTGGSRHAYHAESYVCPGCVEADRMQQAPDLQDARGVHIRLAHGSHGDCESCAKLRG